MTADRQPPASSPAPQPRSSSTHDRVRDQLLDELHTGVYEAGSTLPPERKLAEKFGVSRHSIRQAISSLVSIGLLEVQWGSGIRVTSSASDEAIQRVSDAVLPLSATLGEVVEVRLALEPEIARLAALRHSPEDIAKLKELIRYDHPIDLDTSGELPLENVFHGRLAKAAGNVAFSGVLRTLITGPRRAMTIIETSAEQQILEQQHEELCDAIESGDAEAAHSLMHEHMRFVLDLARKQEEQT